MNPWKCYFLQRKRKINLIFVYPFFKIKKENWFIQNLIFVAFLLRHLQLSYYPICRVMLLIARLILIGDQKYVCFIRFKTFVTGHMVRFRNIGFLKLLPSLCFDFSFISRSGNSGWSDFDLFVCVYSVTLPTRFSVLL